MAKKSIDLQSISNYLNSYFGESIFVESLFSKSIAKFSVEHTNSIMLITSLKICQYILFLGANLENKNILSDNDKSSFDKFFGYLMSQSNNNLESAMSKALQIKEANDLSISEFYGSGNWIAPSSSSQTHLGAFRVKSIADLPDGNAVLKIKNFTTDQLQIRIGVSHEENEQKLKITIYDLFTK